MLVPNYCPHFGRCRFWAALPCSVFRIRENRIRHNHYNARHQTDSRSQFTSRRTSTNECVYPKPGACAAPRVGNSACPGIVGNSVRVANDRLQPPGQTIKNAHRACLVPGVRDAIRLPEMDGWGLDRIRGSHRRFKHPERSGVVTVAGNLGKDLASGTWKRIPRQAGLDE